MVFGNVQRYSNNAVKVRISSGPLVFETDFVLGPSENEELSDHDLISMARVCVRSKLYAMLNDPIRFLNGESHTRKRRFQMKPRGPSAIEGIK